MRIPLDTDGVAILTRRFGELHDSVIRRFSCAFGSPSRVEIELDALALDGAWCRLTLVMDHVSEFRLAQGAAIWGNATSYDITLNHPDGTTARETRPRDLANLALGGPTNQVIFAAAIHVIAGGVFVDLSPNDLVNPAAEADPASWRRSTFYVFGRSGEALVDPVE